MTRTDEHELARRLAQRASDVAPSEDARARLDGKIRRHRARQLGVTGLGALVIVAVVGGGLLLQPRGADDGTLRVTHQEVSSSLEDQLFGALTRLVEELGTEAVLSAAALGDGRELFLEDLGEARVATDRTLGHVSGLLEGDGDAGAWSFHAARFDAAMADAESMLDNGRELVDTADQAAVGVPAEMVVGSYKGAMERTFDVAGSVSRIAEPDATEAGVLLAERLFTSQFFAFQAVEAAYVAGLLGMPQDQRTFSHPVQGSCRHDSGVLCWTYEHLAAARDDVTRLLAPVAAVLGVEVGELEDPAYRSVVASIEAAAAAGGTIPPVTNEEWVPLALDQLERSARAGASLGGTTPTEGG